MCGATFWNQDCSNKVSKKNMEIRPDGDLCLYYATLIITEPVSQEPGVIPFFASIFLKQDRTIILQTAKQCFTV